MAPLRGREAELAQLEALTAAARDGAGGVVVVEGAAGIGKSRLLIQACERAGRRGLLVASSAADELDQVSPWGSLLRALAMSTPAVLTSAELDSLRSLSDQRLAMIARMHTALERAAASQPVLVVVDDLQWADAATLLALGSLPPSLFSYPVGWLLARRLLPADPALNDLLARLAEAGAVRLHLGPLPAAAAIALARDVGLTGTDAELERRIAGAEGNPFYILQLLKAGAGTGAAEGIAPRAPRSAVAQHLRSLSPDGLRLLQVASVLGRDFSVAEVATMTGSAASGLLDAVAEAMLAEMLVEVPAGLAFRHDLLRQAVYDGLPASARVALHRDAAEALQRTGASAVRVAGHLAIGAAPGDESAVAVMQQAVGELTPASPGAAADLALRALELAGDRGERQPGLVLTAVHVLGVAGRSAEARAVGERYTSGHRLPAAAEAALQLQLRQAWVFDRLEAYPAPVPERLLQDPAVEPEIAATLTALDQMLKISDGRGEEADRALTEALRTVTRTGRAAEFEVVARLQVTNALLSGRFGDAVDQAEAALEAVRSPAGGSGLREEMLVTSLAASGRARDALAVMRPALAAAVMAGRAGLVFRYRRLRAALLLSQGRLDDADAEARGVIDLPAELGYPQRTALPLSVMVETALRRGDIAEARSALVRYTPAIQGVFPDLQWAAALAADAEADAAAVVQALAPIRAQLAAGNFFFATTQHQRLPQLVHVARRAADEASARAFAQATAVLAGQNPEVDTLAAAHGHVRALIDNDPVPLRVAVVRAASGEDRLLEAAAREDLGRMLAAQSASTEGAGHLKAAHDFYLQAGARRDAARVRAVLTALGIHQHRDGAVRPRHGWASLTSSEQAVVELVAQGRTNREAAAELFLSPYAINAHLRHAFAKLGIRSRAELARIAADRRHARS